MSGIGSIGNLASVAAQPFAVSQANSIPQAAVDSSVDSTDSSGAVSSEAFSSDYAMSLLAKVTHAGADQALALIQGMLTPIDRG
jgi:hypothetical protein